MPVMGVAESRQSHINKGNADILGTPCNLWHGGFEPLLISYIMPLFQRSFHLRERFVNTHPLANVCKNAHSLRCIFVNNTALNNLHTLRSRVINNTPQEGGATAKEDKNMNIPSEAIDRIRAQHLVGCRVKPGYCVKQRGEMIDMNDQLKSEIEEIRETGLCNMFDTPFVQRLAFDRNYYDLVLFIEDHPNAYFHFVMTGADCKETALTEELLRRADEHEETWFVVIYPEGGEQTGTYNARWAARVALHTGAKQVLLYYARYRREPYDTVELTEGGRNNG